MNFPKAIYLYGNLDDDYHILIGDITDNKLNGYGKEMIRQGKDAKTIVGQYKDGVLNGMGAVFVGNDCVESGFYKDGKLVSIEEFKKDAKQKVIEKATKYGYDFHNCILYYYGDDPENISGYTLLECEDLIVHFISGDQYVKGERSCYQFCEYKDNEQIGLSTFKNFVKNKEPFYDYFLIDKYNYYLELITNPKYGVSLFEWGIAKVEEGKTTLETNSYRPEKSLVLYLPKTITKLEYHAINSDKEYLLEVFYDGTEEEWNKIEKGVRESYGTEDWYGYYYHNAERYGVSYRFKDWPRNALFMIIHCKDKDIESKDRSYD